MSTSQIEWTDDTWNPVRGCTKISPGCKNCYAATYAEFRRGVKGHAYEQGFDLRFVPKKITEPLRKLQPRKIFVNSMSDLFQDNVPDDYIEAVTIVMLLADWHVYQVLTKRSERMKEMLNGKLNYAAEAGHIFWGVSAENREYGLPRIKDLRGTKIRNRFLSVEPLLDDIGKINLNGINWVIVGGESGPGCRPMKAEWALSVRDQCQQANVPFFFKQWGGYPKKKYGRTLEGKLYDEFPQADTNPDIMPRKERLALAESIEAELLPTTYPQELVSIHT